MTWSAFLAPRLFGFHARRPRRQGNCRRDRPAKRGMRIHPDSTTSVIRRRRVHGARRRVVTGPRQRPSRSRWIDCGVGWLLETASGVLIERRSEPPAYLPSFQISAASFQSFPTFSHTTKYLPVTCCSGDPFVIRLKVPISRAVEGPSALTSSVVSLGSPTF